MFRSTTATSAVKCRRETGLSIVVSILLCLVVGDTMLADDEDDFAASALNATNDIEWAQMIVKILDPLGNSVAGAKVRPWALGSGGGHGRWDEITYGSPKSTMTDVDGRTNIVFPKSIRVFQRQPVNQVSLFVSHPDYCSMNVHVGVPTGDPVAAQTVALVEGVRLRIAGVEPGSDQPLSDCHVMLESTEVADEEFEQQPDGWMQSVPIRKDRQWFRVIRTAPGKPVEFSKPQAWDADDPESRNVKVEVRPGVRVMGKISDNVQRPIERGHVVAWCGSPVHEEARNHQTRPIWWIDTVSIDQDGTFEFPSLPAGYMAQFFAFANDSISSQPTNEAYNTCCKWFAEGMRNRDSFFRYGQILRLSGGKNSITIEMEPAGQVRVKCVDPAGRPVRKVIVSSWPNQYMVGGGSTVFCGRQSTLDRLRRNSKPDWTRESPYTVVTDDEGVALIRNLPSGQQSIFAGNQFWTGNQELKVTSVTAKTKEITVNLRRADSARK